MQCLNCKADIKIEGVDIVITKANQMEIIVTCKECEAEYFTNIGMNDLTPSN